MNLSLIFVAMLVLAGCGKDKGSVEHTTNEAEVSVSEMLLSDKAPEESSVHKDFLKHFSIDRVLFGFDQFTLSAEAKEFLVKVSRYLMANLDLRVEVQGNCDIRGPRDYNIALGERRADAVAQFLKQQGVAEHRVTAVSFGSRILVEGDTDEAYAKNRVGIIVIKFDGLIV